MLPLSIHLNQILMLQSAVDSDHDSVSAGSLQLQNKETYRQRLQVYQEAQQRQAQLVQKLQAKVQTRNGAHNLEISNGSFGSNCTPYACFVTGSSIQEEVWGTRGASAGQDLRVWEDEIVGTSELLYHVPKVKVPTRVIYSQICSFEPTGPKLESGKILYMAIKIPLHMHFSRCLTLYKRIIHSTTPTPFSLIKKSKTYKYTRIFLVYSLNVESNKSPPSSLWSPSSVFVHWRFRVATSHSCKLHIGPQPAPS